MPQPFEPMVRPFQSPNTAPAQIDLAPNAQQASRAPIPLFFGKTSTLGSVRIFNGSYQETVSYYAPKVEVETEATG